MSYTNRYIQLKAFNNAADILVMVDEPIEDGYTRSFPALLRGGEMIDLYPTGIPNIQQVWVDGVSQVREDGSVYVAGTASMKDGFWRAAIWDVSANGEFSFRTTPNIILPEDSSAPGEQGRAYGYAVNRAGVMVGMGHSYLAGLAVRWEPPYNQAFSYLFSTVSSFADINDAGLMLVNGVEFDHGNTRNRFSAAVVTAGGIPQEVPLLDLTPTLHPNSVYMMRGEWVTGDGQVFTDGGQNSIRRAFAWKIGSPSSINLPDPNVETEITDIYGAAINSSGVAVGRIANGDLSEAPMYWEYTDGNHAGHLFGDLVPLEKYYNHRANHILINDAGQIVLTEDGWKYTAVRQYDPVPDGLVEFSWESGGALEGDGFVEFNVKLVRAPGNTGTVTVYYTTEDDTAIAPGHYTAVTGSTSWSPGQSGEKTIRVAINDDLNYDASRSFKLRLTHAAGAQLGGLVEANGYIWELIPFLELKNQLSAGFNYGVGVLSTENRVVLKVERIGGLDGRVIVEDWSTTGWQFQEGVDYQLPENLRLVWEPGEGGVKSFEIALLKPDAELPEVKSFTVNGKGILEGTEQTVSVYGSVMILPKGQEANPVIDPIAVQKALDGFLLTISGVQGSIVELQKSLGGLESWTTEAEAKCEDGNLSFNAASSTGEKAAFFRLQVK